MNHRPYPAHCTYVWIDWATFDAYYFPYADLFVNKIKSGHAHMWYVAMSGTHWSSARDRASPGPGPRSRLLKSWANCLQIKILTTIMHASRACLKRWLERSQAVSTSAMMAILLLPGRDPVLPYRARHHDPSPWQVSMKKIKGGKRELDRSECFLSAHATRVRWVELSFWCLSFPVDG